MTIQRLIMLLGLGSGLLILAACDSGAPDDELPFQVTPEPGLPAFGTVAPGDGAGYPGPDLIPADAYPGPGVVEGFFDEDTTPDGRLLTALEAYPLALAVAQEKFSPEASLYQIAPSSIMLVNIGNPPVRSGWFYVFKRPDNARREFVVQVVDEDVVGSLQTEAAVQVGPDRLELDLEQVALDSDEVLARFETYAAANNIPTGDIIYDLELVRLQTGVGPVWSVVDPFSQEWLFSLDATTGSEVASPYG